MSVNLTLAGLSQTPSSNGPDGAADPPSSLDDALRYHGAFIAMLRDGSETYIASVTGTNTIAGTITPTPTAYVTGKDYAFIVANTNTGAVTVNANSLGAKAITKFGTIPLAAGDLQAGAIISLRYDGTQFQLPISGASGPVLLSSQTASASATIDFTSFISSQFSAYKIIIENLTPATNGDALWLRVSEDNGATFKAGASDYTWMYTFAKDNNTSGGAGSTTAVAQITLCLGAGSAGATLGGGIDGEIMIFNPSNTTQRKRVLGGFAYLDNTGAGLILESGGTYRGTVNAINGLRLMFSVGNIASGTVKLYGIQ